MSVRLPKNAQIWFPEYLTKTVEHGLARRSSPKTVWVTIADHYEPLCCGATEELAAERVSLWRRDWPKIAARHHDSAGNRPKYTFFYPQEEYRPRFLDQLAELAQAGVGDVEVHIHHDNEGRQCFVDRMSGFTEALRCRHGLLRFHRGRSVFGFIHGNWALDNSLPSGRYCGLNDELVVLRQLGCYADFTLPSAPSPAQTRIVNSIYWATDDPGQPKSHDCGAPVRPGEGAVPRGDLLMIQGPLAIRWHGDGRWMPRLDMGELAGNDVCSKARIRLWLRHAPRLAGHVFIKLFTHGAQERNSKMLLNGGLDTLFRQVAEECNSSGLEYRFVSAWEMYQAVEAIRRGEDAA